jgi:uncharacterized protein (UPF0335 family)
MEMSERNSIERGELRGEINRVSRVEREKTKAAINEERIAADKLSSGEKFNLKKKKIRQLNTSKSAWIK